MPYTTLRMAAAASAAAEREEEDEDDPLTAAWVAHLNRPRGPEGMAVRWVPDSSVIGCMVCSSRFSLVRRRHHCRRCGACVCAACSTARVPINLLPEGRPKLKNDASQKIPKVLERGLDKIADDTTLKYVRVCSKCAKTIDSSLKTAIRSRHRSSPEQQRSALSTNGRLHTPNRTPETTVSSSSPAATLSAFKHQLDDAFDANTISDDDDDDSTISV